MEGRGDEDLDLGLFGPGSVTWRVHAEPVLMVAGLRALYLQALHPKAIAGVVQNSDYRADPWGRLLRTIKYVATVVYGTSAQARAAGRRVRAVHARMSATDPKTGERFRVDDPELLLWVHISEVESFVDTAQRAGLDLSPEDVDGYYAEQTRAAALVGLDPAQVPASAAEVRDYYREIRPQLAVTRDSLKTLAFLSVPPLPWNLGLTPVRLAYGAVAATAFGLLPPWARRAYGLPGLPTTDMSATLTARTLRLALNALPRSVFEGPLFKAAMTRAERASLKPSE
ncbi:MAG TPA: oxygenase MpaB family protein [Candidatus Limnocylindrales bacterium]